MELRRTNIDRLSDGAIEHPNVRSAYTLVELVVAFCITMMVVTAAVFFFLFSTNSFATMFNHTDLNTRSQGAADLLSRDIRGATQVSSLTTNQLALTEGSTNSVTYTWDLGAGTLSRSNSSGSQLLLQGITSLKIASWLRPATGAAFEVLSPATNLSSAKLISFQWTCSRVIGGSATLTNAQTVQNALVDMRNL